jgi:hypothetical protein
MVASPKGLGPEKDCAGKGQQHIQKTDPSSRLRGSAVESSSARETEKKWRYSSVAEYSPDSNDVSTGSLRICTVRSRCQRTALKHTAG